MLDRDQRGPTCATGTRCRPTARTTGSAWSGASQGCGSPPAPRLGSSRSIPRFVARFDAAVACSGRSRRPRAVGRSRRSASPRSIFARTWFPGGRAPDGEAAARGTRPARSGFRRDGRTGRSLRRGPRSRTRCWSAANSASRCRASSRTTTSWSRRRRLCRPFRSGSSIRVRRGALERLGGVQLSVQP